MTSVRKAYSNELEKPIDCGYLDISWQVCDDLASTQHQWRQLESEGHYRVFQSYGWIKTWYSTIGAQSGIELKIVIGFCWRRATHFVPFGRRKIFGLPATDLARLGVERLQRPRCDNGSWVSL